VNLPLGEADQATIDAEFNAFPFKGGDTQGWCKDGPLVHWFADTAPTALIASAAGLGYPIYLSSLRLIILAIKSRSGVPAGIFTLVFLACLSLLGFALYLQHVEKLDPCPWCIVQRLLFIVVGLLSLVAALHRPGKTGTTLYAIFGGLLAAAGAAAATYHIQIQSDPRRSLECMGSWLERWLDASRLGKMIPPLLQYEGSCVLKPWAFLGVSIPGWSLIWFAVLLVTFAGIVVAARR